VTSPFVVLVRSELYGDSVALARRLSDDGIVVTMDFVPPNGTVVAVHFQHHHEGGVDEIVVRSVVLASGLDTENRPTCGLRFLEFIDQGAPAPERVQ